MAEIASRAKLRVVGPRSLWRMVVLVARAAGWRLFTVFVLLVVVGALIPIGFAVVTGRLIGALPDAVRDGLASPAGDELILALLVLGVLLVTQRLLSLVPVAERLSDRVDLMTRRRVMVAAGAPATIGHLEDKEFVWRVSWGVTGPWWHTPASGVQRVQASMRAWLELLLATALIGWVFEWWLAAAWAVACVSARWRLFRSLWGFVTWPVDRGRMLSYATYLSSLGLDPPGAKELRLFQLQGWLVERFVPANQVARDWSIEARRVVMRQMLITVPVVGGMLSAVLVLFASRAASGQLDIGELAMLAGAAMTVWRAAYLKGPEDVNSYVGLNSPPVIDELENVCAAAAAAEAGAGLADGLPRDGVRFEDVCFTYPTGEREVLSGLSLEIRAGESLAVVGLNGAGKTTLVKLLAGLYQPTGGRITVDGVDLRDLDLKSWQRRCAVVFQDFNHYEVSAADNVALGALDGPEGETALDRVGRAAGLDEIVTGLPLGWHTPLSRRYTDGADLSGGQWQRVALARALYGLHAGAEVLVLDEPTANLDVRAEAELFGRFLDITRGHTTVLISHRFSTVRQAQRIVVVEHGHVVEQGSHDELLTLGGKYATMFTLQAARFTDDAVLVGETDA